MGFLNKLRDRVKSQIQPGNMIARDMGPGNIPRRPSLDFLEGRMPQKRGGGFGNLGEAIRRLQEQRGGNLGSDFRAPRMPSMDFGDQIFYKDSNKTPSMPANPDGRVYAGGSPGLYAPGGRFNRGGRDRIMPNFGREQIPSNQGIPSLPQNLDFLSRLPPNMMPEVDFSNIPQLPENFQFNPQMGQGGRSLNFADYKPQDRQMMQYGGEARPGFVAGGPLIRGALAAGRNIPGRATNLKNIPGPGGLAAQARTIPSFGPTQATIGAAGVGLAADATQGFSEEASRRNMMLNSPEQFGKDLAGLKISFDQVMQIASNKAQEIGDVTGEYVDRVSRAYGEEMENQRMQEMDAQQGMQPFSVLTGPNMPLRRPEPTEGRTTSDIDDLLSSMEKKN